MTSRRFWLRLLLFVVLGLLLLCTGELLVELASLAVAAHRATAYHPLIHAVGPTLHVLLACGVAGIGLAIFLLPFRRHWIRFRYGVSDATILRTWAYGGSDQTKPFTPAATVTYLDPDGHERESRLSGGLPNGLERGMRVRVTYRPPRGSVFLVEPISIGGYIVLAISASLASFVAYEIGSRIWLAITG